MRLRQGGETGQGLTEGGWGVEGAPGQGRPLLSGFQFWGDQLFFAALSWLWAIRGRAGLPAIVSAIAMGTATRGKP